MRIYFLTILLSLTFTVNAKTLIITDSHGEGTFGTELVRLLESKKINVSAYAVGGSTAADWDRGLNQVWGYWEHHTGYPEIRKTRPKTPKFSDLVNKIAPDVVIIELGTNLIWRDLTSQDTVDIQNLLTAVKNSGAKCVWVGPPHLRLKDENQINRVFEIQHLLESIIPLGDCELIASWNFTKYPMTGGDGIHYDQIPTIGKQLAKDWAMNVFKKILNEVDR